MRVFNASRAQHYVHHELDLKPGFTEVPKEREESVRELLKKYPHHLTEGGTAPAELKEKTDLLAAQAAKIKTLEEQNAKLAKLLSEPSDDPKAAANRRADKAEADLEEANARISELTAELEAARNRPAEEPPAL